MITDEYNLVIIIQECNNSIGTNRAYYDRRHLGRYLCKFSAGPAEVPVSETASPIFFLIPLC
jgi:hypothetical protein